MTKPNINDYDNPYDYDDDLAEYYEYLEQKEREAEAKITRWREEHDD